MFDSAFGERLSKKNTMSIGLIGLMVSLAIGAMGLLDRNPLSRLDHGWLDTFLAHAPSGRQSPDTVVIDIDDISLSAIGQWPWPRYRVAALIQKVAAAGPSAIGLDVLLPEADRTSLVNIRETFKRDFGIDVAFDGVPGGLMDNDGYLGSEMSRLGVVGSNYFYFDHVNTTKAPIDAGLQFSGVSSLLTLKDATGLLVNTRAIASQTRTTGFVNNELDDDGVLRRLPLLISHDGVTYANLSLATAMRSMGVRSGAIESDANGPSIRVGSHRIPIDDAGYATLRFRGDARSYAAVSALDVLNGSFREADLKGKIVFIGSSAVGLNDLHNTALDAHFPGLKVQAVMAENIVQDDFVRRPAWAGIATFVACLAVGGLMSALFVVTSGVYPVVAGSAVVVVASTAASLLPYLRSGLFVSPGAPLVVAATLFVVFFVMRFAIEKRRARVWQKQLENARQVTIESMASVAETRDPETGAHIKRTQHYVRAIAEQLKKDGVHLHVLTKQYIDLLFLSAPLHDIGKVGVPDHILLKPGRLTQVEFEEMKKHAEFGRRVILSTAAHIDGDNFLILAGEIAATHHEKWDGTGYPLGLAGEAIPLSGRIMAVADVYDALISRRCYKEAFTHAHATTLMRDARGVIFDPAVLDAFFSIESTIERIAARFSDDGEAAVEHGDTRPDIALGPLPGYSLA